MKHTGADVDPKTDVVSLSAQSPKAAALEQIAAYKLLPKREFKGDALDSIASKISAVEFKATKAETAAAEAAAYQTSSSGGGAADY